MSSMVTKNPKTTIMARMKESGHATINKAKASLLMLMALSTMVDGIMV